MTTKVQADLYGNKVAKIPIPKDKIILLDLNYTLISNSRNCNGAYPKRIYQQRYEQDLVELVKNNYVILITARPLKFKDETLAHIKELTGFVPDESYWNIGMNPPQLKDFYLRTEIFKKHGDNPTQYVAIESNKATRRMYHKHGILAEPKTRFI